ncbi:MAG: TonB-dependent receptor domain-containing protein, partial [Rhodospirillaceae bacterium]
TISFLDPGDAPLVNTGTVIDRIKGEDTTWEIGGDYAQSFGASVKFTGLFVYSNGSVDRDNGFFRKTSNDLSQVGGDTKIQETTEKIIRGTFDWNISRSHDLEIGAEGATNILDKNLDFFSLLGGVRIDTPVLNSDQRITEDRVEIFSTHSWKPLGGMEIESGLAAESSWLDQVGSDVSSNRSLKFLKPSLDIWYNSDDSTQMWFSFRRDVGQLDFDDFVATVNREDNEVLAGNPDLVPEKSWDFEVGIERRLIGGAGLVNGRIFFRRVNDVKDLVPFSLTSSQPGNLGSGNHYGFEVESSIRFGRFTSVDAVLSGSILMQKSEVADPFTGVKRRFGNQPEYEYKLEARHDVKTQGLSYGFDLSKEGPTLESDFNEFDSKATTLDARIFLEKGINDGTVMRFFWANLLEVKALRTRRIFDPSQAAGTIKEIQFREQKRGYIYGFRVRTTF